MIGEGPVERKLPALRPLAVRMARAAGAPLRADRSRIAQSACKRLQGPASKPLYVTTNQMLAAIGEGRLAFSAVGRRFESCRARRRT
jgi:hypothetical protein